MVSASQLAAFSRCPRLIAWDAPRISSDANAQGDAIHEGIALWVAGGHSPLPQVQAAVRVLGALAPREHWVAEQAFTLGLGLGALSGRVDLLCQELELVLDTKTFGSLPTVGRPADSFQLAAYAKLTGATQVGWLHVSRAKTKARAWTEIVAVVDLLPLPIREAERALRMPMSMLPRGDCVRCNRRYQCPLR